MPEVKNTSTDYTISKEELPLPQFDYYYNSQRYRFSDRNSFEILFNHVAMGSCGLFQITGISALTYCLLDDFMKLLLYGYNDIKDLSAKSHCACLDNEHNFEKYKDKLRPYIVQENEYFVNPNSGNKTKIFILDVNKIQKDFSES